MAQLNVTELDFDQIKTNLKSYFTNTESPFKDWDYDGSGLSLLLDVLAYNTHYNAVLAHMSVNESFLDTAQVRSNVVSSAKLLGYLPYSIVTPYAYIDTTFLASANGSSLGNEILLPKGTKFKSSLDGVTYQFVTDKTYSTINVNNQYAFNGVKLIQGSFATSRYSVDSSNQNQKFVIPDANVDISTLVVRVYADQTVSESELYSRFSTFDNITGNSAIYFLAENALGNYEVTFGNNVFGKAPAGLTVVELEYLVTQGTSANGCSTFKYADAQLAYTTGNPTIVTNAKALGGSERESLDSIRKNAPQSLISQNRAVTTEDYKAVIRSEFINVDSISVWGGEYNVPVQYGKVFISIKPTGNSNDISEDNLYLTSAQEEQILNFLEPKRVLSITPVLVRPDYTFLYFNIFFKYNPAITTLSQQGLQSQVNDAIRMYETDNLLAFDGIFRHSKFLSKIDNSNVSILNSTARVYAYKRIDLTALSYESSTSFSFELLGNANKQQSFISSSGFPLNGKTCYLADEYDPTNPNFRNIYVYVLNAAGEFLKVEQSVGALNPTTGLINLTTLKADTNTTIDIYVTPASDDIPVVRNQILLIDFNKTTIFGDIDEIVSGGSNGAINYTTFNKDV